MSESYQMGAMLYDQAVELNAHTDHTVVMLGTVHEYINHFEESPETYVQSILARSLVVAGNPKPRPYEPQFPLTDKALRFSNLPEPRARITTADLGDVACLEAELRLWRSLRKSEHGSLPPSNNNYPAAILYDAEGEPCGYQKSNGIASAYIWRDAAIRTERGPIYAPGDSFVTIEYGAGDDPRALFTGIGFVALNRVLPTTNLTLLRYSTASFPPNIRMVAHDSVLQRESKLKENLYEGANFKPKQVANFVAKLLKQNTVYYADQRS